MASAVWVVRVLCFVNLGSYRPYVITSDIDSDEGTSASDLCEFSESEQLADFDDETSGDSDNNNVNNAGDNQPHALRWFSLGFMTPNWTGMTLQINMFCLQIGPIGSVSRSVFFLCPSGI